MQFGFHPDVDLVAEIAECPGEEHRIQQPAQQQAAPRVEPRHRRAQALGSAVDPHAVLAPTARANNAMAVAGRPMPAQARQALAQPNAHRAATACETKAAIVAANAESTREAPAADSPSATPWATQIDRMWPPDTAAIRREATPRR